VTSGESRQHAAGPSRPGSVLLDIGPGTGALVLFTPADLKGAEIDISPADDPAAARTHSLVRPRWAAHAGPGAPDADRVSYAAVYPGLAAGTYTIWRDADTPAGSATITGGEVTEWHWPAATSDG
jgi:hypothetical protein